MNIAKASQDDIDELAILLEQLESIAEYEEFVPRDKRGSNFDEEVSANPGNVFQLVKEAMRERVHGWRRVVWGFDTLVKACCKADSDILEGDPRKPMVDVVDRPSEPGLYVRYGAKSIDLRVVLKSDVEADNPGAMCNEAGVRWVGPLPTVEEIQTLPPAPAS